MPGKAAQEWEKKEKKIIPISSQTKLLLVLIHSYVLASCVCCQEKE